MPTIPNQGNLSIGINPLAYAGVRPSSPAQFILLNRDPDENDRNYFIGTWILNRQNQNLWILVDLNQGVATWVLIGESQGTVTSLTSNTGGQVDPDMGNINVVGDVTTIVGVGNPGTHTITFSTSGAVSTSFQTDSGTATPALGVITFNAVSQAGSSVRFSGSGSTVRLNTTDGIGNTIMGLSAGNITLTGTTNTALGFNALNDLTSGSKNTIIGNNAGSAITTGSSNIFIGPSAGSAVTTGTGNTIIGDADALAMLTGSTAVDGFYAFGAAIGVNLTPVTPFLHNYGGNLAGNTFLGYNAGSFDVGQTSANRDNTGIGQQSLNAVTTGFNNACCGYQSGFHVTTGESNSFLGSGAGTDITTGSFNTLIGRQAGENYDSTENNNIILGCTAGTTGQSQVMRLGNDGSVTGSAATTKSFMSGVRGVTPDVADAVPVYIDSAGQLGTLGTGAFNCAFSVRVNGDLTNVTGDGTIYLIAFTDKIFDVGNNYDLGTSLFTAPATGLYYFTSYITLSDLGAAGTASYMGVQIHVNAGAITYVQADGYIQADDTGSHGETCSWFLSLTSGDTVALQVHSLFAAGASKTVEVVGNTSTDPRTLFNGFRVA